MRGNVCTLPEASPSATVSRRLRVFLFLCWLYYYILFVEVGDVRWMWRKRGACQLTRPAVLWMDGCVRGVFFVFEVKSLPVRWCASLLLFAVDAVWCGVVCCLVGAGQARRHKCRRRVFVGRRAVCDVNGGEKCRAAEVGGGGCRTVHRARRRKRKRKRCRLSVVSMAFCTVVFCLFFRAGRVAV